MGDTAHSAIVSVAKPEWIIGYDTDAEQGRQQRIAELAKLAASGEHVFSRIFHPRARPDREGRRCLSLATGETLTPTGCRLHSTPCCVAAA